MIGTQETAQETAATSLNVSAAYTAEIAQAPDTSSLAVTTGTKDALNAFEFMNDDTMMPLLALGAEGAVIGAEKDDTTITAYRLDDVVAALMANQTGQISNGDTSGAFTVHDEITALTTKNETAATSAYDAQSDNGLTWATHLIQTAAVSSETIPTANGMADHFLATTMFASVFTDTPFAALGVGSRTPDFVSAFAVIDHEYGKAASCLASVFKEVLVAGIDSGALTRATVDVSAQEQTVDLVATTFWEASGTIVALDTTGKTDATRITQHRLAVQDFAGSTDDMITAATVFRRTVPSEQIVVTVIANSASNLRTGVDALAPVVSASHLS